MKSDHALDYRTLPLELFTVRDLTDALGIAEAAALFGTSLRTIYTVRNTNVLSERRILTLISEIRKDEEGGRQRLIIKRNKQQVRAEKRA